MGSMAPPVAIWAASCPSSRMAQDGTFYCFLPGCSLRTMPRPELHCTHRAPAVHLARVPCWEGLLALRP